MKLRFFGKAVSFIQMLAIICFGPPTMAAEKIIQEEKMSFEKCLKVISTSTDKLSIAPTISDISNQKRTANFTLADGTLTIVCDGEKDLVTVFTKLN